MINSNYLSQVAEFHTLFKHPIEENPTIPALDRCKLRISLISEELKELEFAIQDKNIVEVADALSDLQYVLSGAVLEFGLGQKFKEIFEEVHRSNMSKACKSLDEAKNTMDFYKKNENVDSFYKEINGHFLIYRTSDNKTLKSINYSPANIKDLL